MKQDPREPQIFEEDPIKFDVYLKKNIASKIYNQINLKSTICVSFI